MTRDSYEMNSRLSRGASLFGADWQTQLLTALRNNDFSAFQKIADTLETNQLEHVYQYPDYKTCLEIAVSERGRENFVKYLLERNVNVNSINETHFMAPLHFAVEYGNIKALKLLLEYDNIDVNNKSRGNNTALLLAIKKIGDLEDDREPDLAIYEDMVELLINKGCNANTADSKGVTPIYSASYQGLKNIITLLLDFSGNKKPLDLDTYKDRRGRNARHFLKQAFPEILTKFESTTYTDNENESIDTDKLFSYLYRHEEDKFINDFNNLDKNELDAVFTAHNGMNTMLQLATEKGFAKVIDVLLANGADPNATCVGNTNRPIEIACRNGYIDILKKYIKHNATSLDSVNGDSLLQITINGMKSYDTNDPKINHRECLNKLLKTKKLNVNHQDFKNNTALHYAARNGDDETVLELLRKGACIGLRNQFDVPPLADMHAKTLETYLDECITTNGERPSDDDYEINIRYSFLVYPNNSYENEMSKEKLIDNSNDYDKVYADVLSPETDALLYMTRSEEMRQLLKHPVITSFLYLKWQRISSIFYANITFYSLFWLCFILYITLGYSVEKKQPNAIEAISVVTHVGAIIGLIYLIFRETFQLIVSPLRYLKGIENWVEIALIIVSAWIICYNSAEEDTRRQLSAVAILLSSAELLLLIGHFPTLSTNIEILKTVSWNFFKFLLWYCVLIIAFALSFYTLFKKEIKEDEVAPDPNVTEKEDEVGEDEFFEDPGRSLFKTIVMLTGEFDAGSIHWNTFPVTSHLIFMVFVFMIPIVLFNLLNGLAVSDTQEIRADAELVGHISRIKMISYFESILVGNSNNYLKRILCMRWPMIFVQPLANRISLFPNFLPKYSIIVKPNNDNKIEIPLAKSVSDYEETAGCCFEQCKKYKLDRKIVKHMKLVIIKKNTVSEFDEIKKKMKNVEDTMKKMLHILQILRQ